MNSKSLKSASDNFERGECEFGGRIGKIELNGDGLAAAAQIGEILTTTSEARPFGKFKTRTAFSRFDLRRLRRGLVIF
jgi:hypothetical protein